MRTTLDIDDDVLQVAKELARAEKKTAGRVLSDFARKGMTTPHEPGRTRKAPAMLLKNGFFVLAKRGGPPVTKELVDRLLDEADFEDAGLKQK
jgi:hypothetical protein